MLTTSAHWEGYLQELLWSVTTPTEHVHGFESAVYSAVATIDTGVVWSAGHNYPFGELGCIAKVHFQGSSQLTAAQLAAAVDGVPASYGRLTGICSALSKLCRPASAAPAAAQQHEMSEAEKALQVFCNPLFGQV